MIESDINGEGYGSSHNWQRDITDLFNGQKGTRYLCRDCPAVFVHLYELCPDIFVAIASGEIQDQCEAKEASFPHSAVGSYDTYGDTY